MENFNLSHVPVYIMGEEQLSMYAMYMSSLGNRPDLFPQSGYVSKYYENPPADYEVPAALLGSDEKFARLMEEADKYVGFPYVWGGSTPETSFDCSGFVSYVLTNSGLYKHKIPIDLITFADTGAEHPHTYQFIEIINQWLAEHGMPQITVVQYVDRYGNRLSLETECLRSHTLPSIAYGHKRCSQKHKIAPQEKFCNHYAPCREVWQRGEKVNRYIGYDAGEVKRYEHSRKYNEADKKYHNRYPLIEEWGWNRDDCIREIKAAGLPQPGKSSCFFCPSMKKQEILYLKEHYPDLFNRAATLEENAMPYLKTVKGLGRSYSWKEQFGKE